MLRWALTAAFALAAALYVASIASHQWVIAWTSPTGDTEIALLRAALFYESVRGPTSIRWPHKPYGFRVQHQGLSIAWLPTAETRSSSIPGSRVRVTSVVLPLWVPVVALVIPTTFLWWRDRRPPTDHCQNCGYDLTGNVSGVCPECGTPVRPEGKTR